eukprot:1689758-Heterocapsa_arctica.AAC.1
MHYAVAQLALLGRLRRRALHKHACATMLISFTSILLFLYVACSSTRAHSSLASLLLRLLSVSLTCDDLNGALGSH